MTESLTEHSEQMADLRVIAKSAPDVYSNLVHALNTASSALGVELFDATRGRIAALLHGTDPDPNGVLSTAQSELLDQYVDYVPEVTQEQLDAVAAEMGKSGLRNFVDALYILDQAARLGITHRRLFDLDAVDADALPAPAERKKTTPARASVIYHDAIAAKTILPAVDRELVRLRAGAYHQCGYCNSIRIVADGAPVVSAELEKRLEDYATSDLTDGQKAALTYADAHMVDPTRVDESLRDRLTANYRHDEIVQITLEVSSWNYQKLMVTLSLDAPANDEFLTGVTIDEHGVIHHGDLIQ